MDAHVWARKCQKCAIFVGKQSLAALPLKPIVVDQPFTKWGMDFIGPINPNSSAGHKWILTATNYFTMWNEAIALKEATGLVVLKFYEAMTTRFGVPQ